MQIAHIKIENFRGIASASLLLAKEHIVLVGDNNTCKSTILEAIDLVLGPERLSRYPIIDEHDFYASRYLDAQENPIEIKIELIVTNLSDEQKRYFKDHIQWWDKTTNSLLEGPPPENTDNANVSPALHVGFTGRYDKDEDNFTGTTYYFLPIRDDGSQNLFRTADKRLCGFLFLRTLRTGSRALSLERGSLLDTILRLKEKRLQIWEDVLEQLSKLSVTSNTEVGLSDILTGIQDAVRSFVPADWGDSPHIKISDMTRENLRHSLTVFMSTGAKQLSGADHSAPFQHQGTGTINTLVLALLSLIAELKHNVIFAMEEPEIAIPPHTQKRVIDSIQKKSAQAIFTSHSPYVLEEFDPAHILVVQRNSGHLTCIPANFPTTIKPKKYKDEFRKRFCEALLARRILIVEGCTEYNSFPVAARRLHELDPKKFKTLEGLGIAIINAETDSQVAPLGEHFKNLGKVVFAVFDKQTDDSRAKILAAITNSFEAPETGFENVILNGTSESRLHSFAVSLANNGDWPSHLSHLTPKDTAAIADIKKALYEYFCWSKGTNNIANLLEECTLNEMPKFIVNTLEVIQKIAESHAANNMNTAIINP